MRHDFSLEDLERVIQMICEDDNTIEAIKNKFEITEQEIINLMRWEMKPDTFKMWSIKVVNRNKKNHR